MRFARVSLVLALLGLIGIRSVVSLAWADEVDRRIVLKTELTAPIASVWHAWTTAEGIESFFSPKAVVELRPGGRYEMWFLPDAPAGQRGGDGNIVLGFQPERMLSVTWAMPPYMPEIRPYPTHLLLYFTRIDDRRTELTLIHDGFGVGGEWDKGFAYFQKAWPQVINQLQNRLSVKP